MQDFTKLRVWRAADDLTVAIYSVTRSFPADERYGLTSQVRRSAASIAANIAEGCGRRTRKDVARFIQNAIGSASETANHLHLARRLDYLADTRHSELEAELIHVRRMLRRLLFRLRAHT